MWFAGILDYSGNYLEESKVNRMGMGVGVETRVPFLDYRLVELANNIHSDYKFNERETKIILKELAVKLGFKRENIFRPKVGFTTSGARMDTA